MYQFARPQTAAFADHHALAVRRARQDFDTISCFKAQDRRPDFDHIVRLDAPQARGEVEIALRGVDKPDAAVQRAFKAKGLTEIYFETDDLR